MRALKLPEHSDYPRYIVTYYTLYVCCCLIRNARRMQLPILTEERHAETNSNDKVPQALIVLARTFLR